MVKAKVGNYLVLRLYSELCPTVIFSTPIYKDAEEYANIMKRAEPTSDFAVASVEYTVTTNKQ